MHSVRKTPAPAAAPDMNPAPVSSHLELWLFHAEVEGFEDYLFGPSPVQSKLSHTRIRDRSGHGAELLNTHLTLPLAVPSPRVLFWVLSHAVAPHLSDKQTQALLCILLAPKPGPVRRVHGGIVQCAGLSKAELVWLRVHTQGNSPP